ncbi:M17 family peptidase N-terminal domain-containing protein [Pedobacter sp. CFBP9032]|uniref:M17 family peptidase N-terminal domain-containing protein n=1 Tax=Pedobacter sp. CFBP9032 TaxID=3096539 RepID=UPI002A6ABF18|nr:M17 family peptidase N-terminal domain-containing protein [Pedobacter sp. CFBP9032]MDY0904830.1 M17 family peptidase N-terminal domain-containing protein [Pedobacter sp. CFBP9032]
MKNSSIKSVKSTNRTIWAAMIIFSVLITGIPAFAQQTTAIGTSKIWGTVDGVAIEGVVQGPSAQVSDLQVACLFEYTEGDIFVSPPALPPALNGLVHLDQDMKGLVTEMRKNGKFLGHAYETILISPPKGTIGGKKLLLIGLGDRNKFTADLMIGVGSVAMREALKLGVSNFALASDLKDAGIDSPTALVAGNVVKGIFEAYRAQTWLKDKNMSTFKPVSKIILLAGPAFFTTAGEGIQEAISVIKN